MDKQPSLIGAFAGEALIYCIYWKHGTLECKRCMLCSECIVYGSSPSLSANQNKSQDHRDLQRVKSGLTQKGLCSTYHPHPDAASRHLQCCVNVTEDADKRCNDRKHPRYDGDEHLEDQGEIAYQYGIEECFAQVGPPAVIFRIDDEGAEPSIFLRYTERYLLCLFKYIFDGFQSTLEIWVP